MKLLVTVSRYGSLSTSIMKEIGKTADCMVVCVSVV